MQVVAILGVSYIHEYLEDKNIKKSHTLLLELVIQQ
jgi:hypothetical protein